MRGVLPKQFLDGRDIFGRSPAPLIFPEDDVLQLLQVLQQRPIVIGPLELIREFRLETPDASEFRHANFPLPAIRVFLPPYVLTPHPAGILH